MVNHKVKTRDIIQGLGAGLCLLDKNFCIIWMNKYQADWFGSPEKLYGKHCYKMFQQRSKVCPGCPTKKVFKSGKVIVAKNARGFTKEGQKRYYQLTVSPIRDNSGSVIYALELVQDVTDRVIQERLKSKITRKLNFMCQHLRAVNKKLKRNTRKLKSITNSLLGSKHIIEQKYRKKKNELIATKEELQDIFKVNRTLTSTVDLKKIFCLITRLNCELIHTDACVLWLFDELQKTLVVNSTHGINVNILRDIPTIRFGKSIAGRVAQSKKPLAVYDIDKEPRLQYRDILKKVGVKSLLCVPVIFQDNTLGVISAYSRKLRCFSKEEIEVLNIFASQVAIAIQESQYYDDIHMNYFNTIHALVLAIESRDPYIRGHTQRVTKYAVQIAKRLKLSPMELEILRYASEVHDVGKISIPDFILHKPGRLNPAERTMIELHPVKGVEMLEPLDFLKPALPIIRHHHERFDGTGYPDGLEKENIPLMARILNCADAFDAMTSDRPYRRKRLTVEEALNEIRINAGSQFDPQIARLFIKVIKS